MRRFGRGPGRRWHASRDRRNRFKKACLPLSFVQLQPPPPISQALHIFLCSTAHIFGHFKHDPICKISWTYPKVDPILLKSTLFACSAVIWHKTVWKLMDKRKDVIPKREGRRGFIEKIGKSALGKNSSACFLGCCCSSGRWRMKRPRATTWSN